MDLHDEAGTARDRRANDVFLALIPLALSVVVWMSYQTWSLLGERSQLALAATSQEAPLAQAGKLRSALDVLATNTQKLADEGSGAARTVVQELAKRGVTINAASAASAPH